MPIYSFLSHPPYRMVFVSLSATFIYLLLIFFIKIIFPKKNIPYPLLLLGFSLLPLISIFREGTYESGDLTLHTARLMAFYKNLEEGILIPRWAGELNATFGYALFNFYYPLPYYLASFYHLLGFSFLGSMKVLLITTYIASGFTMFYWLKGHVSEKYAFLGAIFYLFAPYHLVDMHFRVAIGEVTAFAFLPMSFLFIDKSIKNLNFFWIILTGLATGLLILSHPAISLLAFGLIIPYSFTRHLGKNLQQFLIVLTGPILGLLISAFYWLPSNLEAKYVHQNIGEQYLDFPSLGELLYSKWRYGFLFQGPKGELSLLIGYAHWLVIFLAIYLILIGKNKDRLLYFIFAASLFLIFMLLNISAPIWNTIPILKKMLLTYRLLGLVIFFTSGLAALINHYLKKNTLYYFLLALAIASTILNWGNRKNIPEIKDSQIRENVPLITAQGEGAWNAVSKTRPFDQIWQDEIPESHLETVSGDMVILSEERKTSAHTYLIVAQEDSLLKENTYYFPGWELKIDGLKRQIDFESESYPGIITFQVERGTQKIDLVFKDTPVRLYSNLVSLASLFFVGFILITKGSNLKKNTN